MAIAQQVVNVNFSESDEQAKAEKAGLPFVKMHGLSNDFVFIDCRKRPIPSRQLAIDITNRRKGVGGDQLIVLVPPQDTEADVFMRIYNSKTGNEAEACGNATRCLAELMMREKNTKSVTIQTVAGLLHCWKEPDGQIKVDMGIPKWEWQQVPVAKECDTLNLPVKSIYKLIKTAPVGVNIGNPHAVFFVDNVDTFPVGEIGPEIENNSLFPEKTNVEFAHVLSRSCIRMRVWERDAGETEACGSAACATVVAAVRRGYVNRDCEVILNGGILKFHWREDGHLFMTGPVTYVYEGTYRLDV